MTTCHFEWHKGLNMNDFTKDELQEIKRCLKYMIKGGTTPYSCITIEIDKKIKSMIDNYCEHLFIIECADCEVLRCGRCAKAKVK